MENYCTICGDSEHETEECTTEPRERDFDAEAKDEDIEKENNT